jgi:prophage maintenance system killer protein
MVKTTQPLAIYQAENGAIELRGDVTGETLWATQSQIATIFGVNSQAITKHVKNIYEANELDELSTCSKMEQVQYEGERRILRQVKHYNLDMLISIGYRINSGRATRFRIWATQTLKQFIAKGYAFDKKRIEQHYDGFLQAVKDIQILIGTDPQLQNSHVLDLVNVFAYTWFSLDAYDKNAFTAVHSTIKSVSVNAQELTQALQELKDELLTKGEATDIFAVERMKNALEGILGNVMQSFGGEDVYPTLEEKAANLLYLIVKNHPFIDGNKRSGAFGFIWFLEKAKILNVHVITPSALTALTLLIAQSDSKDKDRMVQLVIMLMRSN